jgi:hypothetical protein
MIRAALALGIVGSLGVAFGLVLLYDAPLFSAFLYVRKANHPRKGVDKKT